MKFIDALYGEIDIPIKKEVLIFPELQRLREIRLCNINSPYITGACGINRFEHAIGTCYLASIYAQRKKIIQDRYEFIIAALLHDIVTAPFGHSLEYIYKALGKGQYEHANLKTFFTGETIQENLPYYMGIKSRIKRNIYDFDKDKVYKILKGEHDLSLVIDNDIDIDNIDNVFRLAYHVGIEFDKNIANSIINHIEFIGRMIECDTIGMELVSEWFRVRERLYKYLLEDINEFSSKALLERIVIDLIAADLLEVEDWFFTDSQFILKALNKDYPDIKKNVQRLMTMDLPTNSIIYTTSQYKNLDMFENKKIDFINLCYEEHKIYVHFIRDVNKTCRPIEVKASNSNKYHTIGNRRDRYLIGMFSYGAPSKAAASFECIKLKIQNLLSINIQELQNSEASAQQLTLF